LGLPDVPNWIVRIEIQRIQTFLFAVPRLRAMLGANALLGDMLRSVLPALVLSNTCASPYAPRRGDPPDGDPPEGDPLTKATPPGPSGLTSLDDPTACYQYGILARDGGHLTVAFADRGQGTAEARAFIDAAYATLARTLPDLPVSIRLIAWADKDKPDAGQEQVPSTAQLAELPQFQGCTESGFGVAAAVREDDETATMRYLSRASQDKLEAGKWFQDDYTRYHDFVSLLASQDQLPGYRGMSPKDLHDLSDAGGYIALIHADGNRIGQRLNAYREPFKGDPLRYEIQTEHFFHHMRVAARAAVVTALDAVFTPVLQHHKKCIPYQLLMLGGDDLLLLCQPQYALPFTVAYARALKRRPDLPDHKPLSIGAGIVIAKHSLPFHRLHALAEGLASSAKRAYLRKQPNGTHVERSVADWAVLTTSWGDDPDSARQRDDLVSYPLGDGHTETLALTAKPYFVLQEDLAAPADEIALEQLVRAADQLAPPQPGAGAGSAAQSADRGADNRQSPSLPRGQLKDLLGELGQGRRWAELRYAELRQQLDDQHRRTLDNCITRDGALWQRVTATDHRYLTHLRDLIELTELRYLGRRKQALDSADVMQQAAAAPEQEEQPHD